LGRSYTMDGHVTHGNHLGRVLGFPTANINLKHRILPLTGVYAVRVNVENSQKNGVANIGVRPTTGGGSNILEVYILDFNKDIYGKKIIIEFLHKIRPERKFDNLELLQQQIIKDVWQVKNFFSLYIV
jgi:riboflavin kinase / FMN adenylyltransferase